MPKTKLPTPDEEAAETPEDEASESPAYQRAEEAAGVEQHAGSESEDEEGTDTPAETGAKIPEAFQRSVDSLVDNATRAQLDYIRSCLNERENALMRSESSTMSAPPTEFNDEGM